MPSLHIQNIKTDATVENLLSKIWFVATGDVLNPEALPASSVGLLLIDSVSFYDKAESGGTHFYDYIGKVADGIPEITVGFIGTRPESFNFDTADKHGLMVL